MTMTLLNPSRGNLSADTATPSTPITLVSRPVLEAHFGPWDTAPELCEDGRATRLTSLPDRGALYLTRQGHLLATHATDRERDYRVRLVTGTPEEMWQSVREQYPGITPGANLLPRYWLLQEGVSPWASTYAVFDLLDFMRTDRGLGREEVATRVAQLNQPSSCRHGRSIP